MIGFCLVTLLFKLVSEQFTDIALVVAWAIDFSSFFGKSLVFFFCFWLLLVDCLEALHHGVADTLCMVDLKNLDGFDC